MLMAVYDVILDIETIRADLSDEEWEYLTKRKDSLPEEEWEEYEEKVRKQAAMWGLTGHVVSVAVGAVWRRNGRVKFAGGKVFYLADEDDPPDGVEPKEKQVQLGEGEYAGTFPVKFKKFGIGRGIEEAERRLLSEVWEIVGWKSKDQKRKGEEKGRLVTYNGRRFDLPFLMLRSLALNVPITAYHLRGRYDYTDHLDVMDVLSFHSLNRFASLDFVCRRLGIPTPKGDMDGSKVEEYFREGRYDDIALYNLQDVYATALVYERVLRILGPMVTKPASGSP